MSIFSNAFDMSPLNLSSNLEKIWAAPFDTKLFSENTQYVIKTLLSGIEFIRSFTLHLYMACSVALLWPVFTVSIIIITF